MDPEDPDQLIRDVGRRIRELRRAKKLTQEAVAERLQMGVRDYQYIEAGEQNVTLKMLARIAGVLETRTADLLVPPTSRAKIGKGRPRKDEA